MFREIIPCFKSWAAEDTTAYGVAIATKQNRGWDKRSKFVDYREGRDEELVEVTEVVLSMG